jgi:hypothetical protein
MRRALLLSALAIPLVITQARAQHPGRPGEDYNRVLDGWALRYLRRPSVYKSNIPWVRELQSGTPEETIVSRILGSPEYYTNAGNNDQAFITRLYSDVTGNPPTERQLSYWLRRLSQEDRAQLSYDFLLRHPEGLDASAPEPEPELEYRRPGRYRYDPDYRRDWHDRDRRDRDRRDRR